MKKVSWLKTFIQKVGSFVNGNRVDESFVGAGDVLTIGTLSFNVIANHSAVEIAIDDAVFIPVAPMESTFVLPPRVASFLLMGSIAILLLMMRDLNLSPACQKSILKVIMLT